MANASRSPGKTGASHLAETNRFKETGSGRAIESATTAAWTRQTPGKTGLPGKCPLKPINSFGNATWIEIAPSSPIDTGGRQSRIAFVKTLIESLRSIVKWS